MYMYIHIAKKGNGKSQESSSEVNHNHIYKHIMMLHHPNDFVMDYYLSFIYLIID